MEDELCNPVLQGVVLHLPTEGSGWLVLLVRFKYINVACLEDSLIQVFDSLKVHAQNLFSMLEALIEQSHSAQHATCDPLNFILPVVLAL